MPQINLDYLKGFVSEAEISAKKQPAEKALEALVNKTGAGAEFTCRGITTGTSFSA